MNALVRDVGFDRTAALRALVDLLDMAKTGADDIDATALAEAIEQAKKIALRDVRRSQH